MDVARNRLQEAHAHAEDVEALRAGIREFARATRRFLEALGAEAARAPSVGGWYAAKREELARDPVAAMFLAPRDFVVRRAPVRVAGRLADAFVELPADGPAGAYEASGANETRVVPSSLRSARQVSLHVPTATEWSFAERPEEDAVGVCMAYLSKLDLVMDEARRLAARDAAGASSLEP